MSLAATSASNQKYFPALTGIRALAAYLVFVHHGNPFDPGARTAIRGLDRTSLVVYLHHFVEQWHIGVTIFFVLSGFLITWRYEARIEPSWQWARKYFQNRFARVYPVYFLLTIVVIICWWANLVPGFGILFEKPSDWSTKDKLLMTFLNLSLLRGFFTNFIFTAVGQGWSLTVEEAFYAVCPVVLLLVRNHVKRLVFFPVFFLMIGLLIVKLTSVSPIYLYGFIPSVKFMLNWTFFGRVSEFAIGMGLAFFIKQQPGRAHTAYWATSIGILWIIASLFIITQAEQPLFRTAEGLVTYAGIATNNLFLPIGVAILFWGLIHERTLFRKLLETDLFQVLGKSSYSFYLVHGGLLTFLVTKYTHNIGVLFLITLLVAYLLWRFVEEPLHIRLRAKNAPKPVAV
jgi:peptidoglycan/LPS O-acetylase OafA/YrhL